MTYIPSQDYGTFTAAVDAVVNRSGRAPLRDEIASIVRQTYRSLQTMVDFDNDRVETTIRATGSMDRLSAYRWNLLTGAPNFRKIEAAKLSKHYGPRGEYRFFKQMVPGTLKTSRQFSGGQDLAYYRGGNVIVFTGFPYSSEGTEIDISYFTYLPALEDFGPLIADRPLRYDIIEANRFQDDPWAGWIDQTGNFPIRLDGTQDPRVYLAHDTSTGERTLHHVTNWILFNWFELVVRGALSTILNAVDDPRAPKVFAEYRALQSSFKQGEVIP